MALDNNLLNRLRSYMSRGELVLFTGAGFSLSGSNHQGLPIPSAKELKQELWKICFPSRDLDDSATLGELYGVALNRQRTQLAELLETRFSIAPDSLPDFYRLYFDTPWLRCYTLNVDDLALAAGRKFDLRRKIRIASATTLESDYEARGVSDPQNLDFVHLNGIIPGPPERLTFSETQYAQRIANREPWYLRCVADLSARPIVFIGTELREVPLWQHMELRKRSSSGGRDLRPGSILVTPSLSPSREEMLQELNIAWVEGTAQSFAEEVLTLLRPEVEKGFVFIDQAARLSGRVTVPLVSELVTLNPRLHTGYLMGEEPHWSDLLEARAIERTNDHDLLQIAQEILANKHPRTALAVTGTAGNGKSTSLMRLAIRLSAAGIPVLWNDRDSEAGPTKIREQVLSHDPGPLVLAIDDADLYGRQLVGMLKDLVPAREKFCFVFGLRSSKLPEISNAVVRSRELSLIQHTVPGLTDADIDGLLDTLERHRRLGVLQGKSQAERRALFAQKAGRQLLVAMIEATTGRDHEEKAKEELEDLKGTQRYIYSLVCVASAQRHYLTKDEVLIAAGGAPTDALAALDSLVASHLITARLPGYKYQARHRVIASIVVAKLQELGQLKDILIGLAVAAASKVDPLFDRNNRSWRFLVKILNHSFLLRVIGPMQAREIYAELENFLSYDYHYWLQRGMLEVERGDVRLAELFLNQARSLAPDDYRVETAYAYMLMRRAYEEPGRPEAEKLLQQGIDLLENIILLRGASDPYPYHVLGSQALSWSRRASLSASDKGRFLGRLVATVEDGVKRHPLADDLKQLLGDLRRERLMTAVPPRR